MGNAEQLAVAVMVVTAILFPFALLRVLPQAVGRRWGNKAKIVALTSGLILLSLAWFSIFDAHNDICGSTQVDTAFRCGISFTGLLLVSAWFLIAILSQIRFAVSVFGPLRPRHKSEI
ncbi:hypothetical protein [Bosea sp. (in: a-proteobacteria)]|uniref:hypothetical protein n=1 Tax=Bosea sp. (in: a-proteobacteria) TaxID=1871050 RepID=UPI002FC7F0D2